MPLNPAELFQVATNAINKIMAESVEKQSGRVVEMGGMNYLERAVKPQEIADRVFPLPPALRIKGSGEVMSGMPHQNLFESFVEKGGAGLDPEAALQQVEPGWLFNKEFITPDEAEEIQSFIEGLGPNMKFTRVISRATGPIKGHIGIGSRKRKLGPTGGTGPLG